RPIASVCASLLRARSLPLVSPNNPRYLTKGSTHDRSINGGKVTCYQIFLKISKRYKLRASVAEALFCLLEALWKQEEA
ncbi:MAG: hypothetical protein WC521_09485, partial [Bdellovibrionales bacterium]